MHCIFYMTERFFKTKFGFFSQRRERVRVCPTLFPGTRMHKGITGPKERRRYLRKNIGAEFAANPWSNVSALQKMDKKTRSLEKSCGNESWSKVQKRGPNTSKVFIKVTKTWRNSSLWRKLRN